VNCEGARVFHSAAAADTSIDVGVGVHFEMFKNSALLVNDGMFTTMSYVGKQAFS
jgi:hypothetical protein